ncbi:GNAT family N-acetyltransferase [Peribacillus kribbensis]|uniref:GNAT family N-acetyltransferase n=1 Tax=Peribacillus kribbensis TaxID=356658 RepID=UPI000401FF42|nr:GNAT family N-acetyltransferase [Peribacillus kribbensis]
MGNILHEIRELQDQCEKADGIQLKLNWGTLEKKEESELQDCSHFEDGRLIGFAGVYDFGNKVEICGMVHPDYRRKGICTGLYQKAMKMAGASRGREILLNAPENSLTAKEFLKNIPFEFSVSEFQMKWQEAQLEEEEGVELRLRTERDTSLEIELDHRCFGLKREEAASFNKSAVREDRQKALIVEQDGTPVGKMRVSCENGSDSWIYGFAVLPEFQGRGIGRKALKKIVLEEKRLGHDIYLEVEARNENALKLYTSTGFQPFYTQDYYRYTGGIEG